MLQLTNLSITSYFIGRGCECVAVCVSGWEFVYEYVYVSSVSQEPPDP